MRTAKFNSSQNADHSSKSKTSVHSGVVVVAVQMMMTMTTAMDRTSNLQDLFTK